MSVSRVTMLNTDFLPEGTGGAERSVHSLALDLMGHGVAATVISLSRPGSPGDRMVRGVPNPRVPVLNVYHPSSGATRGPIRKAVWHLIDSYSPVGAKSLVDAVVATRPQVVHTHNIQGFGVLRVLSALRQLQIATVHTMRDYYLLCSRSTLMRGYSVCTARCIDCRSLGAAKAKFGGHVDRPVAISDYLAREHLRHGLTFRYPIQTIPNGIGPRLSREVSDNNGLEVIGFLGQIVPHKGVETLLQSVALMRWSAPQVLVAGHGDARYVGSLKSLAARLNVRAEFPGFVDRDELLKRVGALVIPSIWPEPFGRVVLEAFAAGTPVIASRTGGLPELVGLRQNRGWLFEPGNPEALAACITEVAANPAEARRRVTAGKAALKRYSGHELAGKYLDVYRELVGT